MSRLAESTAQCSEACKGVRGSQRKPSGKRGSNDQSPRSSSRPVNGPVCGEPKSSRKKPTKECSKKVCPGPSKGKSQCKLKQCTESPTKIEKKKKPSKAKRSSLRAPKCSIEEDDSDSYELVRVRKSRGSKRKSEVERVVCYGMESKSEEVEESWDARPSNDGLIETACGCGTEEGQQRGSAMGGQQRGSAMGGQQRGSAMEGQQRGSAMGGQQRGSAMEGQQRGSAMEGQQRGSAMQ